MSTHSTDTSAADYLPRARQPTLAQLARAAQRCEGCDLYKDATQTVFGAGPDDARIMLVGEQPGDQEDRVGQPFVGPAGRLLEEALAEVGIKRDECYVTNAVKHFRWTPRGGRRLHAKPTLRQVQACRPWLDAEVVAVSPQLIVCLGATAAQALLGKSFRITQQRGVVLHPSVAPCPVLATAHPSAVLRTPDTDQRRVARAALVADLRTVADELTGR